MCAVRLERIILEVEDRASRPMATFAASTRGASSALHDLDGSSAGSSKSVTATGAAAATAAPKVSNLAAATARAEAAQRRQADASGSLRVAEAKLLELREKGNAKASALAAAEERIAKARRNLTAETVKAAQAAVDVTKANDNLAVSSAKADRSINQLTGRLALAAQLAITLGPALAPISVLAVPAVTGLASALGFTAIAAGTVVAGFQGVGDALEAVNKAQLEPTAENLTAARMAMDQLSPAAQSMVREIDSLGPALASLRDASAAGLAPGIEQSVENLTALLPKLRGIFEETARAASDFAADATGSLNSERWAPFIAFIEREAPSAITSLGQSAGDLTHGLAELWMAFDPLNDNLLDVIGRAANGFDDWAAGLSETQGFEEFIEYVRQSGPQVAEAFQSLGNAVLQIAEAAAPLGGPVLAAVSAIADAVATIANSPLGTPFLAAVAAVTTLNRLLKLTAALSAAPAVAAIAGGGAATAATAGTATTAAGAAGAGAAASRLTMLKSLAGKAGPIGVGITAAVTGSDILDTFSRSFGTSTADSVDSLAALEDALNRSNVGKYADDLGIDVGRLAEDVDKFGTSGEYYQEVVAKMDEGGIGKALQGFGNFISPHIGDVEKATAAQGDLGRVLDANFELLGQPIGPVISAAGAAALEQTATDLRLAADAGYQFRQSLIGANSVLTKRSASRGYQASIDAATAALKANGKTLDENTPKGRANAEALDAVGASAVAVAKGMKGANRTEFLKGARERFIELARGMGKSAEGAERLADKLGLVDRTKVDPKVFLNIDGFTRKMAQARADLLNLDRKKADPKADMNTTQFTSKQRRALNDVGVLDGKKPTPTAGMNDNPFQGKRAQIMAQLGVTDRFTASPTANLIDNASGKAAGITNQLNNIPRTISTTVTTYFRQIGRAFQQKADGGLVSGPGGPRDDVIPTMLSNGEYVINAASAARNMALLEQINSGGRQSAAAASAVRSAPVQSMAVSFGDVRLTGTVDTRTGLATMTGIARAVANQEIDNLLQHEKNLNDGWG